MPKQDRDFEFQKETKTIRFDELERERLRRVMQSVRQRNALVDPSKLIKELMGLTNNIGLTEEERRIIHGSAPPKALFEDFPDGDKSKTPPINVDRTDELPLEVPGRHVNHQMRTVKLSTATPRTKKATTKQKTASKK